jgi:subtilase family serine protease
MNDKEITKANISTIASGEEVVGIVKNWTCEQKGIYALKIFIDSENSLVEKNKYNNVLVLPINCGSVDQADYKYTCNTTT